MSDDLVVIIDGGSMVLKDVIEPDEEGTILVTGDGHFIIRIEAGHWGSVERAVIERQDA
jgi:hypothetical protein